MIALFSSIQGYLIYVPWNTMFWVTLWSSINDVMQFRTIFWPPSPHRHAFHNNFYYKVISIVVKKSLIPSPNHNNKRNLGCCLGSHCNTLKFQFWNTNAWEVKKWCLYIINLCSARTQNCFALFKPIIIQPTLPFSISSSKIWLSLTVGFC